MPAPVTSRLGSHLRERGVVPVLRSCLDWGIRYAAGLPSASRPSRRAFVFDGRAIPYFRHRHHYTWLNERAVELALARPMLAGRAPERVLEIGNVLSHYLDTAHTVVDRYERAPGVVNADVTELDLGGRRFDLVVSISTLEHVGLDEDLVDPDKPVRAVARLAELLAPGGVLWATVPVGYNPALDERIRSGVVPFTKVSALRRTSASNRWTQVRLESVWNADYDQLLCTAHGLLVCELYR